MPDLDQQLRSLIDGSRPPIELDSVIAAGEPAAADDSAPRRWTRPVLAAAAVILVVATVALVTRDGAEPVNTGPTDSTPSSTRASSPMPQPEGPLVVVGPTELGDLTISASPLVPTVAPSCPPNASCLEGYLWLQHELVVRNNGEETIYIDDTRTSTFTSGQQLIVADDGCGFGSIGESRDFQPGPCRADYRGVVLAPGQSHGYRITLWKELPGMEPLTSPSAWWERELRYDTRPFEPGQEGGGTVAYIDVGYLGLVPAATPSAPGVPIEVTLWHCGIDPITFEGAEWEVPEEEEWFGTDAPAWFVGEGTVARAADGTHLLYTDESGLTLPFVPDDGVEPACA